MTPNLDYIPLFDIIQGHFHKSFELLIKIDCGLWLTVNVVCGPQDEGFPAVLTSAATGCKLAKLGWNKIEHQNTFFQYFFSFLPYFCYLPNIENAICILAFRGLHENMVSLLFH